MRKNIASQVIGVEMITASDGTAFTGTVTVYVTGDGGTQNIGSVGSGICTHEGNGFHTYVPAQAETNYNHVAFTFIGSGAIPVTIQIYPVSYNPTDSVRLGLTSLPNAAVDAAGGLPISDAGGLDLDAILADTADMQPKLGTPAGASISADILVIDNFVDDLETRLTATRAGYLDNLSAGAIALEATLTAIKGSGWSAETLKAIKEYVDDIGAAGAGLTALAQASICTETRLAELDAANLITDVANVKVDTAAIKTQTDALPSGIAKNVVLSNFQFYMVLSTDHVTAATGKTITGTISKDGGAFSALTNAISEIGSGLYKINLTQTEMNADVVTLKFTETNCDQRIITVYTT